MLSTTREAGSLLKNVWAEVGIGVGVGSAFEVLGVKKFLVTEKTLFASNSLRRLKRARGFERGGRLLQVTCQVSSLALEMTEDALHDTSAYARRWASERYACPPPIPHSQFRFLDHHALGWRPRRLKEMKVLTAFREVIRRIEPRSEYSTFPP